MSTEELSARYDQANEVHTSLTLQEGVGDVQELRRRLLEIISSCSLASMRTRLTGGLLRVREFIADANNGLFLLSI
jgi:hypothetical protein